MTVDQYKPGEVIALRGGESLLLLTAEGINLNGATYQQTTRAFLRPDGQPSVSTIIELRTSGYLDMLTLPPTIDAP